MIPSRRVYGLLALGILLAPIQAFVWNLPASIFGTLLFDAVVLGLMVVDGWRSRRHRVQIARQVEPRLSIARDNPVVLSVQSQASAKIQIRDYYPSEFEVSAPTLNAAIAANSNQELTYTVHPSKRGEFQWGDIQVRQLGFGA